MSTILIAGMHRSGTSLVTQWLNRCGLHVGTHCIGASPSNKDGHFEDLEFVRLHEDILISNDLPGTGLTERAVDQVSDYERRRFEYLYQLKNDFFENWGYKDPRTCLFLQHYQDNFPEVKWIFVIRDFRSVVSSMLLREFKEMEKKYLSRPFLSRFIWFKFRRRRRFKSFCLNTTDEFLAIWLAYNNNIYKAIKALSAQKYLLVSYPYLHQEDSYVIRHIAENWKIDLTYVSFKSVFKNDLIGSSIDLDSFFQNESLLYKAKELENKLQAELILQKFNSVF